MSNYKHPFTLYKRGKYWYYRTYTPLGVRTVPKSTGCTSKTAAFQYCEALYKSGALYTSDKTFKLYASNFFDDNSIYLIDRPKPLARNTLVSYRDKLNRVLLPYFANKKLSDITVTEIKKFRIKISEEYGASVVQFSLIVLKIILTSAYKDQLITINPFNYIDINRAESKRRDAFTVQEIKFICDNISPVFRNNVIFFALTGLRISEAFGLTSEDIIKENDLYYINLTKQINTKGEYEPLKNKRPRQIPICNELINYLDYNNEYRYLFNLSIKEVIGKIDGHKERNLCTHSFRHFFITSAKSYGIPDIKVEYIAGHSLKGISNIYTNFKAQDVKEITQYQEYLLAQLLSKETS